jgi:hypothetical protein
MPAAIGFSSHSGWAAAVLIGGPVDAPLVIHRSRILLTSGPLPCEPFHDASRGGSDEAEKTVATAAEEARELAVEAITGLAGSIRERGYDLSATGIVLGGGRPEITVARALSSHAAMHGAEGWLFREALLEASQICGLKAAGIPERELLGSAAAVLGTSEGRVNALVQQLGRGHGPPWGRDQKAAAMAALVALHPSSMKRPAHP